MLDYIKAKAGKKSVYTTAIVFVTILIGFLFYILNYYTHYYSDDYLYMFSFATGERIESFSEIIDSQIAHYQSMNGRTIVHIIVQMFLMAGDEIFNFINVLFFLLLLFIIYFHACGTFKNFSLSRFSLIAMMIFLCCPAFGQSFLWLTGAVNYMYGILIILCFLLPYRIQANGNGKKHNTFIETVYAVTYFLFGIIAGWTNENTSVAMIAMIIGYIAVYRIKNIKWHAWNFTGCIGGIVGCILMLIAPGNRVRLDKFDNNGGIVSWIKRIFLYSCDLVIYLQLGLIILCIVVALYLWQKRSDTKIRTVKALFEKYEECSICLIYLLGFLASVYSMIVPPFFPERAWSGPIFLFLIALFNLSTLVDMSGLNIKIGKTITIGFMLVLCCTTYINAYFDVKNVDSFYDSRIMMIEEAISNGEKTIELPSIGNGTTGYTCYDADGDLNPDDTGYPNATIAKHYGFDKVIRRD